MPFECIICGKYYDVDSGVGYECKGCGSLGTIKRCALKKQKNNNKDKGKNVKS